MRIKSDFPYMSNEHFSPLKIISLLKITSFHNRWLQPDRSVDMQASELIVPSEGATCWENITCTAQTRDHDGTRVYVPYMKVWCGVSLCLLMC